MEVDMPETRAKYLAILRLELDDLHTDIEELIKQTTEERESRELTNYVYMENLALFKNELLGVDAFGRILDELDLGAFTSLEEMVDYLKTDFRAKVKAVGLAEVIDLLVERKLDKVMQYVAQA